MQQFANVNKIWRVVNSNISIYNEGSMLIRGVNNEGIRVRVIEKLCMLPLKLFYKSKKLTERFFFINLFKVYF